MNWPSFLVEQFPNDEKAGESLVCKYRSGGTSELTCPNPPRRSYSETILLHLPRCEPFDGPLQEVVSERPDRGGKAEEGKDGWDGEETTDDGGGKS